MERTLHPLKCLEVQIESVALSSKRSKFAGDLESDRKETASNDCGVSRQSFDFSNAGQSLKRSLVH